MSDSKALTQITQTGLAPGERLLTVSLIDRSGSMGYPANDDPSHSRRDLVLLAHNTYVNELKTNPLAHRIRFARSFFNDHLSANIHVLTAEEAEPLTEEQYVPDGGTALYDAIGATLEGIASVLNRKPMYKYVHLVILSDGEESGASRKWTAATVRERIEYYRKCGWRIDFYGMSEDALKQARDIGIPAAQTQVWHATADGSTVLSASMSRSLHETMGFKPGDSSSRP